MCLRNPQANLIEISSICSTCVEIWQAFSNLVEKKLGVRRKCFLLSLRKVTEDFWETSRTFRLCYFLNRYVQLKRKLNPKEMKQNKTGVISGSTSCQITICFCFQLSFWVCLIPTWVCEVSRCPTGTDWFCYNSIHWVYSFLQFCTYSYNRSSKESAEWQAAIVLLLIKDNKDKVAIFQMKVFSYNCICSTFLNPLT